MASKFSDEFNRSFHLSKKADRGETQIFEITNEFSNPLSFYRNENQVDILIVKLEKPLQIGETHNFKNQISNNYYQILNLRNTDFLKIKFY